MLVELEIERPARDQNVYLNCLDLYHEAPDYGERRYKSSTLKRRFDPTRRAGAAQDPARF